MNNSEAIKLLEKLYADIIKESFCFGGTQIVDIDNIEAIFSLQIRKLREKQNELV